MKARYRKALLSDKFELEQMILSSDNDIKNILLSPNLDESVNYIISKTIDKSSIEILYSIEYNSSLIGFVQFYGFNPKESSIFIGYIIDSTYRGKGILKEICRDLIEIYFDDFNLKTINTIISTSNPASIQFSKKLNFTIARNKDKNKISDLRLFTLYKNQFY